MEVHSSTSSERQFNLDIRRTIILGAYMKHWGMPDYRIVSRKADDVIEIYSFPPQDDEVVHRIASAGISGLKRASGQRAGWELFMALSQNLGGEPFERVSDFLIDLAIYSLREDVRFSVGETIPETPLMPSCWLPRALLLDEPRGEPEELESFHVGSQHVDLIWVVPIYVGEYDLIKVNGLKAFNMLDGQSEWSLADPSRPSLV